MSLDGRINVDCLFHDRSGTARLKVLSLRSSDRYTTGEAIIVTGTAGTAGISLTFNGYRNAAGNLVSLGSPSVLAFSWSGSSQRALVDVGDEQFRVSSPSIAAASRLPTTRAAAARESPSKRSAKSPLATSAPAKADSSRLISTVSTAMKRTRHPRTARRPTAMSAKRGYSRISSSRTRR